MNNSNNDFNTFFSQLRRSNRTLGFFSDFNKIGQRIESIRINLCLLNSLVGSTNMRQTVELIWEKDKSAFSILNILITERNKETWVAVNPIEGTEMRMEEFFKSVEGVMVFLEQTGLKELFENRKINNLVDYVFGIETGLDSNARKNRSGIIMGTLVQELFIRSGVHYRREVPDSTWPEIKGIMGQDHKRFDFVVEAGGITYLIETNFYNTSGSKPNEVVRSYSLIGPRINTIEGFQFVWITDGEGWCNSRALLAEAYSRIPHLYNLSSVDHFIDLVKPKQQNNATIL